MASGAVNLTELQQRKLTELFHKLDSNGDGELDLAEFKALGQIITGRVLTDEEVRGQLSRADADGNDKLDLGEWLAFGQVLAGMEDEAFVAMVDGFILQLDAAAAKAAAPAAAGGDKK